MPLASKIDAKTNSQANEFLGIITMQTSIAWMLVSALALARVAAPAPAPVYTNYPYTGPAMPIGDWVDNSINGNGKGFTRLAMPPAVQPGPESPTNNINVISLSYMPTGVNVHFQTPFGLSSEPEVLWGISPDSLTMSTTGITRTYVFYGNCSSYTRFICK